MKLDWATQQQKQQRLNLGLPQAAVLKCAASAMILIACLSEKTRHCHSEMVAAQDVVAHTERESLGSVNESLKAVDGALAACLAAERSTEAEELQKAMKQLSAHRDRLLHREPKRQHKPLAPEELAALVARGDTSCPRGQAYLERESGKQIRCTGRLVIEMTRGELEDLYRSQGYRVTASESPPRIRAEYGAESYIFSFRSGGRAELPECVELLPAPGTSWQEAVARATGARPDKLDGTKTIRSSRGNLALEVENTERKVVARLGRCST